MTEQTAPTGTLTPGIDELAADAQRDAELAQLRADVDAATARAEAAEKAAGDVAETPTRFAAYDNTYEKFVPGVYDTRAQATKAAKDAKVKDYTVREV